MGVKLVLPVKTLRADVLELYLDDAFTELKPHYEIQHKECIEEMELAYNQISKMIKDWDKISEKAWMYDDLCT